MDDKEIETFYPSSRAQWRAWLQENHATRQAVWLIHYKKKAGTSSISWSEAVDEALCFGWIDSVRKPVDDKSYKQFFSRRKTGGTWSKINKHKIEQLVNAGLMTQAGLDSIEKAKQNGSWAILDDVEELVIPKDLAKAFTSHPGSKVFFMSLSRSVKKAMLQWMVLAKRPETREKRISEIASLAAQKQKPKQF